MFIRAYLRASDAEQDTTKPEATLERFVVKQGQAIAASYVESQGSAKTDRPELLRLLSDARKGDVLLVESIDRISRLAVNDWQKLKAAIDLKGLRIVALDLPTSYQGMQETKDDEFTDRILAAVNSMLIEMIAAIAQKDYEQRRQRQAEGIAKAKAAGIYKGRQNNESLHKHVRELLKAGQGIRATARQAGCSTNTVMKVEKKILDEFLEKDDGFWM